LLAKNLGLNVSAEGAETEEQVKFLKEKRCDTVQGFYYYKPMTAVEMERVLRENIGTP
jgi:EAL domain-containing protein (putative c-di-GMP-specific phosphodiesterase class I)